MATYLYSAYFDFHFVTIAMVKINLIPDPYTWAIVLKLFVAFPWVETSTGPGGFMICVFII